VSATSAGLLRAASEMIGGVKALAQRLAIDEALLEKYLADERELPDSLLLRAVDIVEDRHSRLAIPARPGGVLNPT
jgi:hypothetical protein